MREVDFTRPEKSKQERMKEYNKKYREEHSNMIHCKCGGNFKEISKYTHYKTASHQRFLIAKSSADAGSQEVSPGSVDNTVSSSRE